MEIEFRTKNIFLQTIDNDPKLKRIMLLGWEKNHPKNNQLFWKFKIEKEFNLNVGDISIDKMRAKYYLLLSIELEKVVKELEDILLSRLLPEWQIKYKDELNRMERNYRCEMRKIKVKIDVCLYIGRKEFPNN